MAYPLDDDVETLAERLRSAGYRTAGIMANHMFLDPGHGFDQGFEYHAVPRGGSVKHYLTLHHMAGADITVAHLTYASAEEITDRGLEFIREHA